jgi:hypothetical protein
MELREGKRRIFQYKCPHYHGFVREKLNRHLINKHKGYSEKDAKLLQTKMKKSLQLWIRYIKCQQFLARDS